MTGWQRDLLEELRRVPGVEAQPYGSVAENLELDRWSDLDVRLRLTASADVETLFGARLWAWQESIDNAGQHVRLVFADGRRVDAVAGGEIRLTLPEPPLDNKIRFEGALAAARIGRGSSLIGLHLVLGILREALVQVMLIADRDLGTNHHRLATEHDARASEAAAIVVAPLRPESALQACELYGRWRRELDPAYRADWSGLRKVLARGLDPETPGGGPG